MGIYRQFDAAFRNVATYVVAHNGSRVANIAFKFPRDGAGRVYAYVHYFPLTMVRGFAGGGGYDKQSAAVESAMTHLINAAWDHESNRETLDSFINALNVNDGKRWNDRLRDTGFEVWQIT